MSVGATSAGASPGLSINQKRPANRAASHEHTWRISAGDAGIAPTRGWLYRHGDRSPCVLRQYDAVSAVVEWEIVRSLVFWKTSERVLTTLTVVA